MARRRRKKKRRPRTDADDVTLSQSANSERPVTAARSKKATGYCDTLPDHGEIHLDGEGSEYGDSAGVSMAAAAVEDTSKVEGSKEEEQFNVFPLDFWVVIGDHVHPDSVAAFAASCR